MPQAQKAQEQPRPQKALPMAMRVANAMHKIGVVGLPRNYEILYCAISGTNEELQKELLESGVCIDQARLDELHRKHCARADDEALVTRVCDAVEAKLDETLKIINREQVSVANYGRILNQASTKLNPKQRLPPEVVGKLVGLLSTATETTQEQGKKALAQIEDGSHKLAAMRTELEEYKKLAETDALSGLFNRRAFDLRMGELDSERLKNCALIVGDIDKFKTLNDTYGHPFGDTVIRNIAKIAMANSREDAFLARVGGEEFALLSENINEESMMRIADRLRAAVAEAAFGDGRTKLGQGDVTISFGLCHGSKANSTSALYSQADEALYASKRTGRNRVTPYSDQMSAPDRKSLFLYNE